MKRPNRCNYLLCCLLVVSCAVARAAQKPKVRAVTAFVHLDREHYEAQVREALVMLRAAKGTFERRGYEVQSLRITTQPFGEYTRGLSRQDALAFFRAYDALAMKESFDPNIGPAMLRDSDDPAQAELLGEALSNTKSLGGSLVIAGDDGIHWKSLEAAARLVKFVEEHSTHSQGNFRFAATAMLAPYAPFYPGSYHLGPGRRFSVALQGANLVEEVFRETGSDSRLATQRLAQALGEHATALEGIAMEIQKQSGWTYMGLDATPAPLREVSIGGAIEKFTGARFGSSGTLTAAGVITKAISSLQVKRIGYSGLMLPILEDSLLAQRWDEGTYGIDSLLAYSAVCGTGLDTIPLPGDVSEAQIVRVLGDVATLAVKWHKPLSARLLPVFGMKAGERTEFDDPFLVNATIHALP
jgi:uncharacterized protein